MLNNLNQFKWQITPNPNEKQRERERERERSIKYAAKKGNERGNLEGLINLREEIGRVMGQKGEECWECCLRLLRRYSSHQSHCCFHFSLSLSLSLIILCVCVCVCLCDSIFMYEWMYVFLPSFLCQNSNEGSLCLFDPSFPRGNPLSSYPHLHCLFPNYHPHPFYFIISYFLFNTVL